MTATKKIGWLATMALVGLLALPVLAQVDNNNGGGGGGGGNNNTNPGGGGGGGGGGGPRGGGRQRMIERLKTALGATDEEFAVLQPKIEAVFQAQRDANPMGRGFGRRPQQDSANPSTQPESAVQQAISDLRDTLDDTTSTPDAIHTKLEALRAARTKARADLAKAQSDLKDLLTQRQEATLVMFGLLD